MIYIVIASITILFFIFALLITPITKKLLGIKICAICAACSSTWITLLVLRTLKVIEVDNTLLALLMGGSVVGLMYPIKDYFTKYGIKHFWIARLLEVTVGFYLAYAVAICDKNMILIGAISATLVLIIILMLINPFKKRKSKEKKERSKKEEITEDEKLEAIEKLEKSLEDCC